MIFPYRLRNNFGRMLDGNSFAEFNKNIKVNNPFHVTRFFVFPLKTSENHRFFDVFSYIEREQ